MDILTAGLGFNNSKNRNSGLVKDFPVQGVLKNRKGRKIEDKNK